MGMDASEATVQFNTAKDLFGAGQYTESMRLLMDLDRQFPNTRNILLAMATCLEKLECLGEAEQICDRLLAGGPDAKAATVKARIAVARSATSIPVPEAAVDLDIPLRTGVPHPPAAREVQTGDRRRTYIIAGVIAAAVLILALPFVLRMAHPQTPPAAQQTQATAAQQAAPTGDITETRRVPVALVWVVTALASFLTALMVLYPCLRMFGRLQEETLVAGLAHLAMTMGVMYLLGLVPLVGWILGIMHFMRQYELSTLEALGILLLAGLAQVALVALVLRPMLLGGGLMMLGAMQ